MQSLCGRAIAYIEKDENIVIKKYYRTITNFKINIIFTCWDNICV
tara:strand:- start:204 stop:338 length:135 start_codon:yes stop_codon:yes gene_type:complete